MRKMRSREARLAQYRTVMMKKKDIPFVKKEIFFESTMCKYFQVIVFQVFCEQADCSAQVTDLVQ